MHRLTLIFALPILVIGCASQPKSVNETQTEIAVSAATVAGDIATVKEITDKAKSTGEITKQDLPVVIKYVDKAHDDVVALNSLIEKQTKNISTMTKTIEKEKAKSSILFKWAIIASIIAAALAFILYISRK